MTQEIGNGLIHTLLCIIFMRWVFLIYSDLRAGSNGISQALLFLVLGMSLSEFWDIVRMFVGLIGWAGGFLPSLKFAYLAFYLFAVWNFTKEYKREQKDAKTTDNPTDN